MGIAWHTCQCPDWRSKSDQKPSAVYTVVLPLLFVLLIPSCPEIQQRVEDVVRVAEAHASLSGRQ